MIGVGEVESSHDRGHDYAKDRDRNKDYGKDRDRDRHSELSATQGVVDLTPDRRSHSREKVDDHKKRTGNAQVDDDHTNV